MKIKYKIEILSEWHIGSGLDAGADADAMLLKDENNLPFIPGKTIKGLLRDSLNEIESVGKIKITEINNIFGWEEKDKSGNVIKTHSGNVFFSNAELPENEKNEIISNNLTTHLYKNIASTRIDKRGIAKDKSLRIMEVCIPLTLEGEIETNVENADEVFLTAFKWTRYIGVNRNRGLGRCKFILTEKQ